MIKSIRWIIVYIRPRENNHEEKWKIMKPSLFNKNRHDEIDSMHVTFFYSLNHRPITKQPLILRSLTAHPYIVFYFRMQQ